MPDLDMDVDVAVQVPVNVLPLLDDTDGKTIETAIVYNSAGIAITWNFVTCAGVMSQTAITPTTSGVYDWLEPTADRGMYGIEIPASGGVSANNDTEGCGWITGVATGVLPFRGPFIRFRAAGLNDKMIESAYDTTRGLAGTALPAAAAEATGGLYTRGTGAGQIAQDANGNCRANLDTIKTQAVTCAAGVTVLASVGTAATSTAQTGDSYALANGANGFANIKTDTAAILVDTGTTLDGRIPAALTANGNMKCSLVEILTTLLTETAGGYIAAAFKKLFDVLNPTLTCLSINLVATPPTATQVRQEMDANSTQLTAIVADTGELQTDWANSGRLDLILDARASQASVDVIDGIVDGILLDTAEIGAAGAGLTSIPNSAGVTTLLARLGAFTGSGLNTVLGFFHALLRKDAALTPSDVGGSFDNTTDSLEAVKDGPLATAPPTAAANADAVWDEVLHTDHEVAGSASVLLQAAGTAADPWLTPIPGAYGAGTAGKILGDNINAPIATVDTVVDGIATTLGAAGAGLTAVGDARLANLDAAVSSRLAPAGTLALCTLTTTTTNVTNAPPDSSGVTTLLARLGAFTGTGWNTVLGFFRALLRKDVGVTLPTDIAGTFDNTTDSVEAIRDTAPLGTAMRGTDNAAQAATALDNTVWTGAKAAFLDEAVSAAKTLVGAYDAAKTAAQVGNQMDLVNAPNATALAAIMAKSLAAESYAADGATPTHSQMLWMIWGALVDFVISGTTMTIRNQAGGAAMTFTLDDATNPTSRTRAT